VRAGDILLATIRPQGLSARNLIPGTLISLEQRDVRVIAKIDCGIEMEVHLTLAARDSLALKRGGEIWLVLKTHFLPLDGRNDWCQPLFVHHKHNHAGEAHCFQLCKSFAGLVQQWRRSLDVKWLFWFSQNCECMS